MAAAVAVPPTLSLHQIKAKFRMNKDISSNVEEVLKAQNVSWATRTAIKYSPVSLLVDNHTDDATATEYYVSTQLLPGGIKSEENRVLDNAVHEKVSPVFGPVKGQNGWITVADAAAIHPYLGEGWDNPEDAGLVHAYTEGDATKKKGCEWYSHQVFGFAMVDLGDGKPQRMYISKLWFRAPGLPEGGVTKRLVYDYCPDDE
ncbi:uncharacterized protein V1510DRAFT_415613 [Dipodascopsis tothii]|uniref:uncharacterized protein n=1 Tax=Dipodascopsis tothii TaxID=44089 RepID=UPI0034CDC969